MPKVSLTGDIPVNKAYYWRNDVRIWQWCRQFSALEYRAHLEWEQSIHKDPSVKMFGIKNDGEFVGVCGLTSIDRVNQKAEFSLYIGPEFQRKGYARIALRLLLQHGFENQNLNRIWGESFDGNPAQSLFLQLGMRREGTLRQSYFRDGNFIDSHIYAITREEFYGRNLTGNKPSGASDSLPYATSDYLKVEPPNKDNRSKAGFITISKSGWQPYEQSITCAQSKAKNPGRSKGTPGRAKKKKGR